jgi:hypothetical protein
VLNLDYSVYGDPVPTRILQSMFLSNPLNDDGLGNSSASAMQVRRVFESINKNMPTTYRR